MFHELNFYPELSGPDVFCPPPNETPREFLGLFPSLCPDHSFMALLEACELF